MVLPYGGTILACREYIQEYLTDTYSPDFIWTHFGIGANPTDCMFKVSVWLSKILWQAIQETLNSAIVGMAYLRKIASLKAKQPIEWLTPIGLLIKQAYPTRKKSRIRTELHGSLIKVTVNISQNEIDYQRQLNAMDSIVWDELQQIITIAKVLQYGAERYEPNNWRLIPQEEHINHALIHIIAELSGDTQDEHREHALCRLMMALATKQSEGFSYNKYITKTSEK